MVHAGPEGIHGHYTEYHCFVSMRRRDAPLR